MSVAHDKHAAAAIPLLAVLLLTGALYSLAQEARGSGDGGSAAEWRLGRATFFVRQPSFAYLSLLLLLRAPQIVSDEPNVPTWTVPPALPPPSPPSRPYALPERSTAVVCHL
jgi:hypothetical protein